MFLFNILDFLGLNNIPFIIHVNQVYNSVPNKNMSKKLYIGEHTLEMEEYKTAMYEHLTYGLNVYVVWHIKCSVWEYLMPSETLRETSYRDVNVLWRDFIYGDKDELINRFLQRLNNETGLSFHLATHSTLPRSLYERFSRKGCTFDKEIVRLIVYGNNR